MESVRIGFYGNNSPGKIDEADEEAG